MAAVTIANLLEKGTNNEKLKYFSFYLVIPDENGNTFLSFNIETLAGIFETFEKREWKNIKKAVLAPCGNGQHW